MFSRGSDPDPVFSRGSDPDPVFLEDPDPVNFNPDPELREQEDIKRKKPILYQSQPGLQTPLEL